MDADLVPNLGADNLLSSDDTKQCDPSCAEDQALQETSVTSLGLQDRERECHPVGAAAASLDESRSSSRVNTSDPVSVASSKGGQHQPSFHERCETERNGLESSTKAESAMKKSRYSLISACAFTWHMMNSVIRCRTICWVAGSVCAFMLIQRSRFSTIRWVAGYLCTFTVIQHVINSRRSNRKTEQHIPSLPRVQPRVCGLQNQGNTCFMNSALQCLSHTTPLREYFIGERQGTSRPYYEADINPHNPDGLGGSLARAYGDLLGEMFSEPSAVVHPGSFKKQIGHFAPRFAGNSQQDAQELITFLLDGLHEDLNRIPGKKRYVNMTVDQKGKSDKEIAEETWRRHLLRNNSEIVSLFQGQIRCVVKCPDCDKGVKTFEPVMQLTLPIPEKKTPYLTLEECLQFFCEEKHAKEKNWPCTECSMLVRPVRKVDIWKMPPIVIIHLKRFATSSYGNQKVDTLVKFTQRLSLAEFTDNSELKALTYDLYAVINHYGVLHSGHYTAFVKHDSTWFLCDDRKVEKVHESDVITGAAYVLFYEVSKVVEKSTQLQ